MSPFLERFGFDLNNRELAALVYIFSLICIFAMWRKGSGLASSLFRAFFALKLAAIWVAMSIYVVVCVIILAKFNIWDWSNLKTTLLWWLTVGFSGVFEAKKLKDKPAALQKLVRDAFRISVVILFVVELVSFPLWVEMLMLPALFALSALIAVGENQNDRPEIQRLLRLLHALQITLGAAITISSFWLVSRNLTDFLSLDTIREFGIPLLLWLMFIPFILLISVLMNYDEVFRRLQLRPKQSPVVGSARWQAFFAFGWNTDAVRRLARDMREREIIDKAGVREAIKEIRRLLILEKKPNSVPPVLGWSPHVARLSLEKYGLVTEDYHRTNWSWFAQVRSVKLAEEVLSDKISYSISGNELAVTCMRLSLDGSNQNDVQKAQLAFDERAHTLLAMAIDAKQAPEIYAATHKSRAQNSVIDGVRVSLETSMWGDTRRSGYNRTLIIRHPAHHEPE